MIKNNQNKVLLVDIKSIDSQQLNLTLRELGYHVVEIKMREYKQQCNAGLLIVDIKTHGHSVITDLKNEQFSLLQRSEHYVPILAIVDVAQNDKEKIFQLGAFDYISSPLIVDELKNRIKQAVHLYRVTQSSLQQSTMIKQDLCDKEQGLAESIPPQMNNNTDYLLAEKTAKYLKSQLSSDVNLNDLARKMTTNRNKLSRAFKAYFGTTVFNWLREQRMLYAVELLGTTSDTILQIAEQVGYPDSNNFSTAFKRAFQLAPMQYRKVQQTKNAVPGSKVNYKSVQVD